MCLCASFALAQGSSTKIPAAGFTAVDSTLFITDLTTVVRENSKVVINWRNSEQFSPEFVVVERSSSGGDFEVVAVLKQSGQGSSFEWVDDAPAKGRNLYRIRFDGEDGQPYYSRIVSALIAGDISFRFYPNPVDNILILRSEGALDVQVLDGSGKVRISQNRLQGIQTINVASLEKGVYYLRINNRSTGVVTQEKLLKN
ncbi:MAG TPA: T9SS type A sorting domain-containing protein [Flavisolibacter sp.]|nr:T9SS type A sorting domain-containing protein [Flavisolibacter sp.]